MNKIIIGVFLLLIAAGIYLFGSGITGFVVSETCCFPPNCPAENICPSENNRVFNGGKMALGLFLVVASALLYGLWHISSKL